MYHQTFTRLLDTYQRCRFPVRHIFSSVTRNQLKDVSTNYPSRKDVSPSLIKRTLERNNCRFEDGFTCISTRCTNCREDKNGTIYINKVTGFYICMECQDSGNWENIADKFTKPGKLKSQQQQEEHLTSKKKVRKSQPENEVNEKWNALSKMCSEVSSLADADFQNVSSTFKLYNSSKESFNDLKALIDKECKNLYFPLLSGKKYVVGVKQLTLDGVENSTPAKECCGLLKFIPNKVKKNCDTAILVLTITDLLALSSCKIDCHIICVPHGSLMLPQEVLPMLEQYKKLVFWFGNDSITLDAARTFSKKLNEDRCFIVRITDKPPSLYLEKTKVPQVDNAIRAAKPLTHKNVITFANLKDDIWSELTNTDKAQGIKWKRFPILNELLRGHRRGELTVLTGPTGCGKTTFLSEYSLDLALQGVPTLWGSFEIRNQRLAMTMLQQMSLLPLNENLDKFSTIANEFEKLPIYFLKFHGPQPVKEVMEAVDYATYIYDIQHLVIDNLQFMIGLTSNTDKFMDRFYQQDMVIAAFRNFATQQNCHVTLIIHPKKEKDTDELSISSIFGGAKATQEADNILIIQKKLMQSLQIRKYLQIVKNRYSGDIGIMPLSFNKTSLSFAGKNVKE